MTYGHAYAHYRSRIYRLEESTVQNLIFTILSAKISSISTADGILVFPEYKTPAAKRTGGHIRLRKNSVKRYREELLSIR